MDIKKIVCKTFYLIVLSVFIFIGISIHPFFSENKKIYSKNTAYSLRPPLVSDAELIAAYNQQRLTAASKLAKEPVHRHLNIKNLQGAVIALRENRISKPEAYKILSECLRDPSASVRIKAVSIVLKYGHKIFLSNYPEIDILRSLASIVGGHLPVCDRTHMLQAKDILLTRYRNDKVCLALLYVFPDATLSGKELICSTLAELKNRETVMPLLKLAQTETLSVKLTIAKSIASILELPVEPGFILETDMAGLKGIVGQYLDDPAYREKAREVLIGLEMGEPYEFMPALEKYVVEAAGKNLDARKIIERRILQILAAAEETVVNFEEVIGDVLPAAILLDGADSTDIQDRLLDLFFTIHESVPRGWKVFIDRAELLPSVNPNQGIRFSGSFTPLRMSERIKNAMPHEIVSHLAGITEALKQKNWNTPSMRLSSERKLALKQGNVVGNASDIKLTDNSILIHDLRRIGDFLEPIEISPEGKEVYNLGEVNARQGVKIIDSHGGGHTEAAWALLLNPVELGGIGTLCEDAIFIKHKRSNTETSDKTNLLYPLYAKTLGSILEDGIQKSEITEKDRHRALRDRPLAGFTGSDMWPVVIQPYYTGGGWMTYSFSPTTDLALTEGGKWIVRNLFDRLSKIGVLPDEIELASSGIIYDAEDLGSLTPDAFTRLSEDNQQLASNTQARVALSILSASDFGLVEEVREAKSAGVDIIHVDYLDGKFTPGSEPFDCAEQIRKISHIDIPLEVHIMATAPAFSLIDKMIAAGLKPGRDKVLIHYESFEDKKDFRDMVAKIKTSGLDAGIVLNPETPVSVLNEFSDILGTTLNSITIMAIVPGSGKRPFIPTTLEKIRELKKILYDRNINNVEIETDGGINEGTLEKIIKADIDLFVTRTWLVDPKRGLGQGMARIREICNSVSLERKAIEEALQESGLPVDPYTLDSIIGFCNGSEVFLEKDIRSYLEQVQGVTAIFINKDRVVDIYFNKKLARFHKRGVVPIEHLGLEDRAYYKGIALKVYAGNIALTGKGEYTLGISGSWHDSTAVLLKNGRIVAALEEERMTRTKHDASRFPVNAIHRLLKEESITLESIRHISIGWNYNEYVDTPHSVNPNQEFFEDMDERYAKTSGIPVDRIIKRNVHEKNKKRFDVGRLNEFLEELKEYYGTDYMPRVSFVRHHLAHAASAYYACGFKEPVLTVVLDGYGDTESGSVWIGRDGALEPIKQFNLPNSLGWVWAAMTEYLGFKPTLEEGQVMGFAPYGEPRNDTERKRVEELRKIFEEYIYFDPEKGELAANPAYLYYGKIAEGKIRVTEELVKRLEKLVPPCTKNSKNIDPLLEEDRPYANLAFVLQEVTNNIVTDFIRYYLQKDPRTKGIKKVAFGGGIALNILANGKIISEGLVKGDDIFVQPAANDAGTAIGAAMAVEREIYGEDVNFEMSHAFYGPEYSNEDIKRTLDKFGLVQGIDYEKVNDNVLVEKAAQCIKKNKPIAWFQGRCEIGPRALGNRSILLNLLDDTANNTANRIKGRQEWRPSASSISGGDAKDYFEGIAKSPFMVIAYDVLPDKKKFMASGVHQYGKRLARPQTVDEMSSPLYSRLLKRVGELVGVPAVVNTSFNKREPLVESPEEAINAFFYMKDVTRLFIGNYIVTKRKAIKPTIISLLDERFLNGSLKKAISTGDINDWDALFDIVNIERPGNYKIKVTLDCGVYGTREISIPLAKELFEGSLKAILMRYAASSIYNYAIEFQAEKIYIGSDSDKMDEVVYYLMRDYLKENFKRMDFFANSGREVKILSMREKSKSEKRIDSSERYFVRPLGQEAIKGMYIGVDVGASRIKCSVLEDGKEIKHKVVDTTIDGGEALKLLIKVLIKDMAGNSKVSGIGISLPGVVDSNSNNIIWLVNYEHRWKRTRGSSGEEVDFKGDYDALNSVITELKEEYGIDNIGILNDATSFGVAALNIEKETDAVIMSIGTGVGAARLEGGLIDAGRIEQSGGFVVNVKEDAPFDEGCSAKGCFASYIGASGIIDISRRLGLSDIIGKETLSVAAIIHLLESGSGIGYAEANRIYDIVARHIVSWIELMHKMRGDSRFIISGGVTAGQAGDALLNKINNILKEREDISVALSKVDREYGGAIGAAFFAMSVMEERNVKSSSELILQGAGVNRAARAGTQL